MIGLLLSPEQGVLAINSQVINRPDEIVLSKLLQFPCLCFGDTRKAYIDDDKVVWELTV